MCKFFSWLYRIFNRDHVIYEITTQRNMILSLECLKSLTTAFEDSLSRQHEGITYLLGRTDGFITIAIFVYCPKAHTTKGSYCVEAKSMGPCVELADKLGLQIVGKVHSHPGEAFLSLGDIEKTHIQYPGFISLIVPNYGKNLPDLKGSICFMWTSEEGWLELDKSELILLPGEIEWKK